VAACGFLARARPLLAVAVTALLAWTGAAHAAGGGGRAGRDFTDAPYLHGSNRFVGESIQETRLSDAVYKLTEWIRRPRMVAVACWSDKDWNAFNGGGSDKVYSTVAFWSPDLPHWVQLSPQTCRAMETLLHHRPAYPNAITADAVVTLTHETMHAIGIEKEAEAECFGMQLTTFMAIELGVPAHYAQRLGQLSLQDYWSRPPDYIDTSRCREDGAWDLFPGEPSEPWHLFAG
jgi:hypothetical protein